MNTLKLEFVDMVRSKKAQAEAKRYSKLCKIKREVKRNAIIITAITIVLTLITGCSAYHDKVGIFEVKATAEEQSAQYPMTAIVVETSMNSMTIEDFNGHQWVIKDYPEEMMLLDMVALIMDDNGTDNIEDDIIVDWKYSGWVSLNEYETYWEGIN